jgi:hypothetical protein
MFFNQSLTCVLLMLFLPLCSLFPCVESGMLDVLNALQYSKVTKRLAFIH